MPDRGNSVPPPACDGFAGQVQARAETPPGPGEHHDAAVVVGGDGRDAVQLLDEPVASAFSRAGRAARDVDSQSKRHGLTAPALRPR
jgi:hypothetical protein